MSAGVISEKTKIPLTLAITMVSAVVGVTAWMVSFGIRHETKISYHDERIQRLSLDSDQMKRDIHNALVRLEKDLGDIKVNVESIRKQNTR